MARTSLISRLQAAAKIHREILQGGYPSATRLGTKFRISPKTARGYLAVLHEAFGFEPVYDEKRHGYHYALGSQASLLPRLGSEEVVAVFVLEQAARALESSPLKPVIDSALNKFSMMLPSGCGMDLDRFSTAHSLRFERAALKAETCIETLATVWRALSARQRLQIEYRGRRRGASTVRKIDPLHLAYCEGQWYLVAFCHLRDGIRTFVPSRMTRVDVLDERFALPRGFNPEEHFQTAFGIVADCNVAPLILRFRPPVALLIRERHWHATQRIEELPQGSVRLHMTCSQGDELKAWIMSWGEWVDIEAPMGLAREIAQSHRRAAARFGRTRERVIGVNGGELA